MNYKCEKNNIVPWSLVFITWYQTFSIINLQSFYVKMPHVYKYYKRLLNETIIIRIFYSLKMKFEINTKYFAFFLSSGWALPLLVTLVTFVSFMAFVSLFVPSFVPLMSFVSLVPSLARFWRSLRVRAGVGTCRDNHHHHHQGDHTQFLQEKENDD